MKKLCSITHWILVVVWLFWVVFFGDRNLENGLIFWTSTRYLSFHESCGAPKCLIFPQDQWRDSLLSHVTFGFVPTILMGFLRKRDKILENFKYFDDNCQIMRRSFLARFSLPKIIQSGVFLNMKSYLWELIVKNHFFAQHFCNTVVDGVSAFGCSHRIQNFSIVFLARETWRSSSFQQLSSFIANLSTMS